MGNVCCSGRTHSKDSHGSSYEINKDEKKIDISHDEPKSFWDRYVGPLNWPKHEEKSEAKTTDYEPKSVESKSPENFEECLEYEFDSVADLNRDQKSAVADILDSCKPMCNGERAEELDGFLHIIEVTHKDEFERLLMFTTCAVYVLDLKNHLKLIQRIPIEILKSFHLTKSKEVLIIKFLRKIQDKSYLCLKCERMGDLLKGIQQLALEMKNEYLPWNIIGEWKKTLKLLKKGKDEELFTLKNFEKNPKIIEAIVKNGDIGEQILIFEPTAKDPGFFQKSSCFFLLTDAAIYTLGPKSILESRIPLSRLTKVEEDTTNSFIIAHTNETLQQWKLPSEYKEIILNAARSCSAQRNVLAL
ncbi:unnamed protein product [Blepharisma stoltei]|uniref:Uncharacterized protein n=1 Tax=Blepharisma stoltei TaxID=1481888 RepID=A0AAU9JWA8_9CILI|nr:unnamed protein product [Blepharisma stoltei]